MCSRLVYVLRCCKHSLVLPSVQRKNIDKDILLLQQKRNLQILISDKKVQRAQIKISNEDLNSTQWHKSSKTCLNFKNQDF